jgi:hypothetical protein
VKSVAYGLSWCSSFNAEGSDQALRVGNECAFALKTGVVSGGFGGVGSSGRCGGRRDDEVAFFASFALDAYVLIHMRSGLDTY